MRRQGAGQVLDNKVHGDGKNPRTSAASLYFCMAPSHDATKPVGQWNTGRIVCKGSVIQHWLNGRFPGGSTVPGGVDYQFDDVSTEGSCFGEYSKADANELTVRIAHDLSERFGIVHPTIQWESAERAQPCRQGRRPR